MQSFARLGGLKETPASIGGEYFTRQTLNSDLKRHPKYITGIISIDMNDLKWLNDNHGHKAGYEALKTITDCFCAFETKKECVYRIGGDEFVIVCKDHKEEDIKSLVEKIRAAVTETGYSCAFGYSFGKSIDEMMQEADKLMYQDKRRIKEELKAKGIEHSRH